MALRVDIDSSFKRMKKENRFDERKLVFHSNTSQNTFKRFACTAPIFHGHPEKPMVSFLINVAWGEEYLPGMLATLKKNNVHATFFFEGDGLKANPDLAKMIADAGHELGNHSYSHPNMKTHWVRETREEINKDK